MILASLQDIVLYTAKSLKKQQQRLSYSRQQFLGHSQALDLGYLQTSVVGYAEFNVHRLMRALIEVPVLCLLIRNIIARIMVSAKPC